MRGSGKGHRAPGRQSLWWVGTLLVVLSLVRPADARSETGPIAPCGSDELTPYPPFADSPTARNWRVGEIPTMQAAVACIGWDEQRVSVLTALASRFRINGGVDEILARFAAQSAWRGIRYWSVSDHRWATLITDATALDSTNHQQRRADFTLQELKSGTDLYFLQEDNRSSDAVIYRMRVMAIGPNRLVVTIENVSAVSLLIFTLFDPGDLQSTYFFVKLGPTDWGYYSLSGVREGNMVIGNYESSYLNRAAAIYRHLVGIPGDQEPPMAP